MVKVICDIVQYRLKREHWRGESAKPPSQNGCLDKDLWKNMISIREFDSKQKIQEFVTNYGD